MSKNNRNHGKKSSPPSGPKVIVQQPSNYFETITLEEALAQSEGKGLGLLRIPDMTPLGWEECSGIAASDMQTMNALTELAHRLQHSGEVREKERRARKKKRRQLAEQYVTLDQMAALVNRSKKTLARKVNASGSDMPDPDVQGGGGKPHEWKWSTIRPWLERQFNRQLPERFPQRFPR